MDILVNIGIPQDDKAVSKRWLNHILADTYVMFIKARKSQGSSVHGTSQTSPIDLRKLG